MATRDLSSITSALVELFYDDVTNNINRAVVLAQLLDVKQGSGQSIQWTARFGTATPSTAPIADGADVTTFNLDNKVPAILQYGGYHDAFEVTGKAAAAAAAAGNPAQLADLFGEDMLDSSQRLARAVAAHVYTGSGASDQMHGLTATAGPLDTTGTYANIARGTYAQWASNEVDAASAGISFALLRQTRRTIYQASGEKPDLLVCDPEQHEKYGLLFGSERRYVDEVRLANGKNIKLDGGYQVLEFDGIPLIEDDQCPSNRVLFLNTRYLYLSQLPDPVTMYNQSMGQVGLSGTPEEQYGDSPVGLQARVISLAKLGDKYPFELILYPQVVSRRCNVHGSLINLA